MTSRDQTNNELEMFVERERERERERSDFWRQFLPTTRKRRTDTLFACYAEERERERERREEKRGDGGRTVGSRKRHRQDGSFVVIRRSNVCRNRRLQPQLHTFTFDLCSHHHQRPLVLLRCIAMHSNRDQQFCII
jgi:hypothetical protein